MPTQYKGPPREVRALDAYIKLMRAAESLATRVQQRLTEHDLTLGQLAALEALLHLGPMNQRELGRKLLRSNSNVCTVLDNLERAALVERQRGTEDRRVVTVLLTPAGRELIARIFPGHATDIADLLGTLSPEEQETLGALCKKLGLAISQR